MDIKSHVTISWKTPEQEIEECGTHSPEIYSTAENYTQLRAARIGRLRITLMASKVVDFGVLKEVESYFHGYQAMYTL